MKYKIWQEESRSGSKYINWELTDEQLIDEFETEIGYSSQYSIRYSDHKRPLVINGYASYEHNYLYDTRNIEDFELAKKYLTSILDNYTERKISIDELSDLLFNVTCFSMKEYLEKKESNLSRKKA